MNDRRFISLLPAIGIFLFACQLSQVAPASNTATSTAQNTQLPLHKITVTLEKTIVPSSPAPLPVTNTIEVRQWFALQIPRTRHTATLLPDGKILLVGGSLEPDDFVADEELFNPVTGLSSWTAPLHTLRHGHSATLLPDGRVLVIGGYSLPQQWLNDAEIYDPSQDTWTVVPPLHSHATAHSATLMKDGRVLVVGGCIGSGVCTETVEIFDPKTNSWSDAQPLKSDRASQTAQLLADGRILIAGGTGAGGGSPLDGDGALYDPGLDIWKATGSMLAPRHSAQSVLLQNGKVLVAGGFLLEDSLNQIISASVEIYDPNSNTWSRAADLNEGRYAFVLISLPNGEVLAIGGSRTWECCWNENSFVHEIEAYDPAANEWKIIGEIPQPRAYATGMLLPKGHVWIAGGQYGPSGATFPPETWLVIP